MELCGINNLETMYFLKVVINIVRYSIIGLLIISSSIEYYHALGKKDKDYLKEVIKRFNLRIIIVAILIFIPVFTLIFSKLVDKPNIYNCIWKVNRTNIIDTQNHIN